MILANVFDWLAGDGRYMKLHCCMGGDTLWLAATVALDFLVAGGYALIAWHWYKNERRVANSPAKKALSTLKNIFIFCGICGYLFIPIKMVWPAWRLYDLVMVVLAFFTWRYAWNARDLKVIYTAMGQSTQLAEDLARTREESRRKSFFLNAVSHDLRTPLNGLMLQAHLAELAGKSGDMAAVHDAIAGVQHAARTTTELLDQFLLYARADWGGDRNIVERVDLQQLVQEVVRVALPMAEQKRLQLSYNCPPRLSVDTDKVKLERVLQNLLSNAIKFTDAGSVRVDVETGSSAVEIAVVDTGCGMPPDAQSQAFDEFFQAHNGERDRRKGFGLGLAIARRLARQLGGDVSVDSAVGMGSRFTIALPMQYNHAPEPAKEGRPDISAMPSTA